jgi:large subunit ribosomal protein L33
MAKKKKVLIRMQCQECKTINYFTNKSRGVEEKLEFKKFCKFCRKHTLHKELKKK